MDSIYTTQKVSPAGKVNATDLKKIVRDTAIFFTAPTLIYLGQLQGTLAQSHILILHDFIPNAVTVGAIEGWTISIVINFFLKLSNTN